MSTAQLPALLAPVIAHRGASADAPENTLAALSLAAKQGARCVEIDVSISADGVPFVHHDDRLDRCTNGHGLLCEQTAVQLDQLDASHSMAGFSGEALPRLEAVITLLKEHRLGLNLEIKPRQGLEVATVDALCAVVEQHGSDDLPLVFSSFSRPALAAAQDRLPDVARALLVGAIPENWLSLIEQYDCRNIHCSGNALTPEQTIQLKEAGLGVYCYTVNDSAQAQALLDTGVHGVFTDHPKQLLSQLEI